MVHSCVECKHLKTPFNVCCTCTGASNFEPKREKTVGLQKDKMQVVFGPAAPGSDRTVVAAIDAVAEIMHYSHPLYEAFDDAVAQATKGKGVRHGGGATPFLDQPWHQVAKHTGVGGLIFQMVKKAQEACGKEDQEAFERELLGALVYGGAAYLYVKQHGFKK